MRYIVCATHLREYERHSRVDIAYYDGAGWRTYTRPQHGAKDTVIKINCPEHDIDLSPRIEKARR